MPSLFENNNRIKKPLRKHGIQEGVRPNTTKPQIYIQDACLSMPLERLQHEDSMILGCMFKIGTLIIKILSSDEQGLQNKTTNIGK